MMKRSTNTRNIMRRKVWLQIMTIPQKTPIVTLPVKIRKMTSCSSCHDKENKDYDNKRIGNDDNDEEVVVDMEGELISALEEIDRLIIKNKKQKQLLIQFEKDRKQPDEDFALLKVKLEEENKIEDILKQ
jgi:hypothetical protein